MTDKPSLTQDQIEAYAIRVALGNNGGEWLKTPDGRQHYTEDQKQHWRNFISALSLDIWQDAYRAGYSDGRAAGNEEAGYRSRGQDMGQ